VISPPLTIPPDLGRNGIEHYRRIVEQLLDRLTQEAEAWAESGTHKLEEVPLRRESARSRPTGEPESDALTRDDLFESGAQNLARPPWREAG
jgi:hypothetical protein